MKKIGLIIPAKSKNFYVEDILVNISLWSLKPSEVILINTSKKKIFLNQDIKKNLRKNNVKIKIIDRKNLFPGAARNAGIRINKNDYVVFLDMNTLPYDKNWLKVNYEYLIKNDLDGVCGQTYYLAENYNQKVIRASSYGRVYLRTIPGSIFSKNTVEKVGYFNSKTRAGEDTEWLKKLDTFKLKIKNAPLPVFYKGLYNVSFLSTIKKWFRNYFYSSDLPHLSTQKNFYIFTSFLIMFFIVFNWNYNFFDVEKRDSIHIPHVTKVFLIITSFVYIIFRGIYLPIKKNIKKNFLFPYNFLVITFFSFILDLVKTLTFFLSSVSRILNLNRPK